MPDAGELIEVDYAPFPPMATTAHALDSVRPAIWRKAKGNVLYRASDTGDIEGSFATADRIITERFDQHRQSNQPIEPRAALAEIDPETGESHGRRLVSSR